MSCQSNSNKSKLAAVKCGISRAASATAYAAGVGGGVALGAAAGTLALPGVGTLIGGAAGGAGAATLIKRKRKIKMEKKREKQWSKSEVGKKALIARGDALDRAERKLQERTRRSKAIRSEAKATYEAARKAGVRKIKRFNVDSRGKT